MRTSEQPTAELDEQTRAYTRLMVDVCKRSPAEFAALVRVADEMRSMGIGEADVRGLLLDMITQG